MYDFIDMATFYRNWYVLWIGLKNSRGKGTMRIVGYKLQILISSYLSFTEDSPPRIRIHREGGYYTTGTSGELLVYPGAIIHIDCLYHRNLGNPEWTLGNRYEYIQGRRVTRKPYPTGK